MLCVLCGVPLLCHHAALFLLLLIPLNTTFFRSHFQSWVDPLPSVEPFLRIFRNFSSSSFFTVCRTLVQLGVHHSSIGHRTSRHFNPCLVDRLRRLSVLFKDHFRLVECPNSRCHRYRDLYFTRKRWLARHQCPANGFILRERERGG